MSGTEVPLPQGMGMVGCPPAARHGLRARNSQTHLRFSLSAPVRGEEASERFLPFVAFPPGRDSSEEEQASPAGAPCESSLVPSRAASKLPAGPVGAGSVVLSRSSRFPRARAVPGKAGPWG